MAKQSKAKHQDSEPAVPSTGQPQDDELIVVPKGQSKLQFYFILFLMLFVLVIFTVGPWFESVMASMFGGEGGRTSVMSWVDPGTGERFELDPIEYQRAAQDLHLLSVFGFYLPLSTLAQIEEDPLAAQRSRGDIGAPDVALWLIHEQEARRAGIEVPDADLRARLRAVFGDHETFLAQARAFGTTPVQVETALRRLMRAERYAALVRSTVAVADPARIEELWAEDHVQHAFQYVQLPATELEEEARAELLSDEELEEWLRGLPAPRQQVYHSQPRMLAEVAWVPLGEDFDAAALLARYPLPETWDAEVEARAYYDQVHTRRFRSEAPPSEGASGEDEDAGAGEEPPEGEGAQDDAGEGASDDGASDDGASDGGAAGDDSTGGPRVYEQDDDRQADDPPADERPGQAGDDQAGDDQAGDDQAGDDQAGDDQAGDDQAGDDQAGDEAAAGGQDAGAGDEAGEPSEQDEPSQADPWYRPFEEVEEIARAEAPIVEALEAWLADLRLRRTNGEEIDFAAEAVALGLAFELFDEPLTQAQIEEREPWGGPFVANSIRFGQEGSFPFRVIVEDGAIVLPRLVDLREGELPPFEEIRERVADEWASERALELAVEHLEAIRAQLGASEDEEAPPVVDAEAFRAAVEAADFAELEVVDRPWLERFELPDDDFDAATPGDMHIRATASLFELEEGAVPPAAANAQRTHAILVRYAGERAAPIDEMTPGDLAQLEQQAMLEATGDFERRYQRPLSEAFRQRYQLDLGTYEDRGPSRRPDDPLLEDTTGDSLPGPGEPTPGTEADGATPPAGEDGAEPGADGTGQAPSPPEGTEEPEDSEDLPLEEDAPPEEAEADRPAPADGDGGPRR